ncbi:Nse4-like protein [Elsinoe fawcettii]|nr:Nse4-like protein [Elsinoe fawcettii]
MPNSRLPTPNSAENDPSSRASKRRRISRDASPSIQGDDDIESEEELSPTPSPGDDQVEDVTDAITGNTSIAESANETSGLQDDAQATRSTGKTVRFYDPKQDERERREIKRKSRALERDFHENRDDYLRGDNDGLTDTIVQANAIFKGVKQTSDATTDSRLLVSVSDITHRKSAQLALSDNATGVDVDEFVSKVISYTQRAAEENGTTASQRRRADDEDDDTVLLDWSCLGARACFPYNSRPPVPSFLLGPLSVQKRVRAPTQRRARQRDDGRQETQPENIERHGLPNSDNSTVQAACKQIKRRLIEHCTRAMSIAQEEANREDLSDAEVNRLLRKHRITSYGGPPLFDFVINPKSFGQTVENLFYVSFLIKEGEMGVEMDEDGLPALVNRNQQADGDVNENSKDKVERTRHQAVFGIDYGTWQKLVEAYDIKDSLIPHREESQQTQPGRGGWYS